MAALTEPVLAQLRRRLAPRNVSALRPLAGGASSLTYAGDLGNRRVVVKVAPPGVAPIAHRDVLRQARLIRALGPTPVPVPEVLFEDPGEPPDAPPLFVMSHLDGTTLEPLFDSGGQEGDAIITGRFREAARVIAQLHRIDPDTLDLGPEPVVGPSDEVERWCRTLQTVDSALVPGWCDVAAALRSSTPAAMPAAVIHGDFRLGNLLAVNDRITAVIDWEIWSLGDPRVDVGWFLVNCDPRTYRRPSRYAAAAPPPAELAATYSAEVGHEVSELDWFQALACFKSTATWSLIVKHNRRRSTPDPELEAMASGLPRLLSRARQLLG